MLKLVLIRCSNVRCICCNEFLVTPREIASAILESISQIKCLASLSKTFHSDSYTARLITSKNFSALVTCFNRPTVSRPMIYLKVNHEIFNKSNFSSLSEKFCYLVDRQSGPCSNLAKQSLVTGAQR